MNYIKIISLFSLSLISLFSVAACNSTNNTSTISSSDTLNKYTEKEVNVYYKDSSKNQKTKLRFYEETKDIPYIGIKEYYDILVKNTPLATKGSLNIIGNDNIYKVETPKGGHAVINTNSNTFTTENFILFNSINYFNMSSDKGLFLLDGMPWVKISSVSYNRAPSIFNIEFNKYKINLFGDNNDVYFPFNTVSDLFLSENLLNCAYNQKDIYVINGTNVESVIDYENYKEPIFQNKLSSEYMEYNYMEYCLRYDHLLGRPNRSSIERNFNLENGLDYALSNNELGKEIKKLILSTDYSDYLAGTQLFSLLFSDGGHTKLRQLNTYYSLLNEEEKEAFIVGDLYKNTVNTYNRFIKGNYQELKDSEPNVRDTLRVRESRQKMLGLSLDVDNNSKTLIGTDSYYRKNDTAIIFVDDFMGEVFNRELWDDYYAGKRDNIPFGDNQGGCVGAIYNGLLKAKADDVSNVIIDLSSNSGGSVDELIYLLSALTNKNELDIYNYLSGQIMKAIFDVDVNLDKKFDENDNISLVDDFNLAVITSNNGYSCGGISPIYLHEANILTIGENSGGGSCSIYYTYDCYGLDSVASSPHQICTLNGAAIDSVRNKSCDIFVDIPLVDGEKNYDELFNLDKLTGYIYKHYSIN